jgi:hypothetical protein
MLVFAYNGDSYFTLRYDGDILDAARHLDPWILEPHADYPRFCYFNTGYTGLVDGIRLVGATSGAVIVVGHVVLTSGTLAGTVGEGVLFFREVSGVIVSGENLQIGGAGQVYAVTASVMLDAPVGQTARGLFVQAETNSVRFTIGGLTPTTSTGTPASLGVLLQPNENVQIMGRKDVVDFQIIHAVAASNASVNMIVSY